MLRHRTQLIRDRTPDVDRCRWFLACENKATTVIRHPVLGGVPACAECASRVARIPRARMINLFLLMEAIHSTALEHPNACNCLTCRAANGDKQAFDEIIIMVNDSTGDTQ